MIFTGVTEVESASGWFQSATSRLRPTPEAKLERILVKKHRDTSKTLLQEWNRDVWESQDCDIWESMLDELDAMDEKTTQQLRMEATKPNPDQPSMQLPMFPMNPFQSNINPLQQQFDALQQQNKALQQRIEDTQAEKEDLKRQHQESEQQNSVLQRENESLSSRASKAEEEDGTLRQDLSTAIHRFYVSIVIIVILGVVIIGAMTAFAYHKWTSRSRQSGPFTNEMQGFPELKLCAEDNKRGIILP